MNKGQRVISKRYKNTAFAGRIIARCPSFVAQKPEISYA